MTYINEIVCLSRNLPSVMSLFCRYSVAALSLPRSVDLCYAICAKGKGGHQNRMRVIHEKGDLIMASFTGKVVGGICT